MMLVFTLLLGLTTRSQAQDSYIVDVRRNITLAENDPVYKDFYISGGASAGMKKDLVVTAVRKINIRDASGANAVGEIMVPVGQLKIIAVFDKVTVAREFTLLSRDELPMLEQTGMMTGDRIEVKGAFIDTSKPKKRKIATEDSLTAPSAAAAAAPAQVPASLPTEKTPPVESAKAEAEKILAVAPAETLEKTADSGNNSVHE